MELIFKALHHHSNIEVPRIHDVSKILLKEKSLPPKETQAHVDRLVKISRILRRDRELAFYGTEDLTPMEFYDGHINSSPWVWINVMIPGFSKSRTFPQKLAHLKAQESEKLRVPPFLDRIED